MKSINDIGVLAVATRMKRVYDTLQKEVKQAYTLYDFDFDLRWFATVYALIDNGPQSITELAACIGVPHPNLIQLVKELEKQGWLTTSVSEKDKRVKIVSLTEYGQSQTDSLQGIWDDMRKTINVMIDEGEVDFWAGLLEFEASLAKKSFHQRLEEQIHLNKHGYDIRHPGKWYERKFDFEHNSTTPHIVLERASLTSTRLETRIRNCSEAELSNIPDKRWSVKQNIGHLTDLEPIWLGRVQDILDGKEMMREIDLTNKKTDEANHNFVSASNLIANFESSRSRLVELCWEHFDELENKSSLHPRLGIRMRIKDLLFFIAEHDDHHLATIHYLLNKSTL